MMKQVRKEEKKLLKQSNKLDIWEDDEDEFNPIELRMKRQDALLAAKAPVLSTAKRNFFTDVPSKERFPYVFDSKLTGTSMAGKTTNNLSIIVNLYVLYCFFQGFVSGKKIMLPENVTRKDSSLCEEVHIPLPMPEQLEVGNKLVQISSLDEV